MADFPINVVIKPQQAVRGSNRVKRELRSIESQANSLRDTLTRAFTFVGIGFGIQQLTQLTDAFTILQNRLRSVTGDELELAAATQEVFDIATRVRAPVRELTTLYSRISVSSQEFGASQQEVAEFVELTGKALSTQGTSGQEAAGALLQLAQAIGGTVIQAQEFNSLIDGARPLLEAVANGSDRFGGSVNALRSAVRDGQVTSEEFFEAALRGSQIIEERFARSLVTVDQAFNNLRTETLRFVSESDTLKSIIEGVSEVILFLADNVDTLARVLGITATVLTLTAAFTTLTTIIKALTIAIASNPFGVLVVGITTAVTSLAFFSDEIKISENSIVTLGDVASVTFEIITDAIDNVVTFFEDNFGFIADFASDIFSEVDLSIESVLKTTARVVDGAIGFWTGLFNEVASIFSQLPPVVSEFVIAALNKMIEFVEFGINQVGELVNDLATFANLDPLVSAVSTGRIENEFEGAASRLGNTFGDSFKEGLEFSGAQDALEGILTRAEEIARERIERERQQQQRDSETDQSGLNKPDPEFLKLLGDLREQQRLLGLNNQEREIERGLLESSTELNRNLTASEKQLLDVELRRLQVASDRAKILDELNGPQEQLIRTQKALNQLLKEGEINAGQYETALRAANLNSLETATDFASGFQRGLLKLEQSVGDFSTISETAITGAFNGATDAIINFVTTGQSNFKQLTSAILADIARIALQQALLGAFSTAFGGLGGAAAGAGAAGAGAAGGGAAAAVPGFQTGGEFTVGGSGGLDSQMVQFRATPGEKVTVETAQQQRDKRRESPQLGGQGGQSSTNIINVVDPALVEDFLTSPKGEKVLVNTIRRNNRSVSQVIGDSF